MNYLHHIITKLDFNTERYILIGLFTLLPLMLLLEVKMNIDVMNYKNIRLLFAGTALFLFILSYLLPLVKRNLNHLLTAYIYVFTSHTIFLNYVNDFSFYFSALLVGTVTICSFFFNSWRQLFVYQLSMLLVVLQASFLTTGTNDNIIMFLSFYIVMNIVVAGVQTYIFHKQEKLEKISSQLKASTQRLMESNKSLEQFAYIASHDLKEPLRTVNSYLGLLKRRYSGNLDLDADEFIKMCTDATKRMHELIDGLLKYSKNSADKMEIKEINLNEVVDHVLGNLETSISENKANIEVQKLPTIEGDKVQLSQLFQNLISNAIKYRSELAPKIFIQFRGTDSGQALISVEDNGIGLPENKRAEVFKLFSRYHTEKADGSGLGLAICEKIVSNHKGNIWVENSDGNGCKFCFTLEMN